MSVRLLAQIFFPLVLRSLDFGFFFFSCSQTEWPSLLPAVPRTVYNSRRYVSLFEAHHHIRIQPWTQC
jgi:hypothetical protein